MVIAVGADEPAREGINNGVSPLSAPGLPNIIAKTRTTRRTTPVQNNTDGDLGADLSFTCMDPTAIGPGCICPNWRSPS